MAVRGVSTENGTTPRLSRPSLRLSIGRENSAGYSVRRNEGMVEGPASRCRWRNDLAYKPTNTRRRNHLLSEQRSFVMVAEGPPSTTLLCWTRKNRGCRAFARHDEVETTKVIAKVGWYNFETEEKK